MMRTILALVVVFEISFVNSDCGFPALPDSTKINIFQKRYEEHSFVQYECDLKNKLLIGNSVIRCFNGKWIGITPKCAKESTVKLDSLMITNVLTKKRVVRFFGSSISECYKPRVEWNITNIQKWKLQIKTNKHIDYFSLVLIAKDLMSFHSNGTISIKATILRPHKHCKIVKFEAIDETELKIRISFLCYAEKEDIFLASTNNPLTNIIKDIVFDIHSETLPVLITFCNLLIYSVSDSCGSPEKPLHSIELSKGKSFTVFSCEEDFYLEPISNQKVICGEFGNWNKAFPICVAKTYCRLPAFDRIDHFLHIEYKDLNYINGTPFAETNSIALYSCQTNNLTEFELKGVNKRVCKHGFWSDSQPKCVKVKKRKDMSEKPYKSLNDEEGYYWYNNHNNHNNQTSQFSWNKLNVVIISMLASFIIGGCIIGLIIYLVLKFVVKKRRIEIPSVIISEPNNYYERNIYEQYRYESIRLSGLDSDLERINSLYQTDNNTQQSVSQRFR